MESVPEAPPRSGSEAAPKRGEEREKQVRQIFSEIAHRYDLLNHVLSLNIDRAWRRRTIALLDWQRVPEGLYLDACAGTYDLALELSRQAGFEGRVVTADFAHPMLVQGAPKLDARPVHPVCGDSLRLPFAADTFDGITVGFGVRNLSDLAAGLAEFRRVLKPGAKLVVLECSDPPNRIVRTGYHLYFHHVLPVIGRIVSGHPWAYTYLPESVKEFPEADVLAGMFEDAGFQDAGFEYRSAGIAAIHYGTA